MKLVVRGILETIEIVQQDIKELLGKKSIAQGSLVFIDNCTMEDASILAYRCQSIYDLGIVISEQNILGSASVKKHEQITKKELKKEDLSLLNQGETFKVQTIKCVREEPARTEFNAAIGNAILEATKNTFKVDLQKPEIILSYLIEKEQSVLCLDLIGGAIHKRPYKIFSQANSLNGVLAYTFLRLCGAKKKNIVVDCCCGSGIIPIEFAQYITETSSFVYEQKFIGLRYPLSKEAFNKTQEKIQKKLKSKKELNKKNIFAFDKSFTSIANAKKNAKLAGILDAISFSKVSLDWIDAKFEKGEVDILLGNIPKLSQKTKNEKDIKKFLDELFYQARFIVRPKGFVGVLFNNETLLEEASSRHGFTIVEKRKIIQGEQEYIFMKFSCPLEPQEE